ncbi:hypothetical protein I317_04529 [Kwoniella heveanensis CBS 569]|nr:hypothetical protein I317_04529 [Kwoniella heveanensis CBS 569]
MLPLNRSCTNCTRLKKDCNLSGSFVPTVNPPSGASHVPEAEGGPTQVPRLSMPFQASDEGDRYSTSTFRREDFTMDSHGFHGTIHSTETHQSARMNPSLLESAGHGSQYSGGYAAPQAAQQAPQLASHPFGAHPYDAYTPQTEGLNSSYQLSDSGYQPPLQEATEEASISASDQMGGEETRVRPCNSREVRETAGLPPDGTVNPSMLKINTQNVFRSNLALPPSGPASEERYQWAPDPGSAMPGDSCVNMFAIPTKDTPVTSATPHGDYSEGLDHQPDDQYMDCW